MGSEIMGFGERLSEPNTPQSLAATKEKARRAKEEQRKSELVIGSA
jgi:hypothetical protein